MTRKESLEKGEIYHVMNKSISGFRIFNCEDEYLRMIQLMWYYSLASRRVKFSDYLQLCDVRTQGVETSLFLDHSKSDHLTRIIAYGLMPTHFHIVLQEIRPNGISKYMRNLLDGYCKYFNLRHRRKGPLWVGPFKNVHVTDDSQLLHVTRYIHLNPVSAGLVTKPEEWAYSSYREYIIRYKKTPKICDYSSLIELSPLDYRHFVEEYAGDQRELAVIKSHLSD